MTGYKAEIRLSQADAELLACLLTETLDPPPAVSIRENGTEWMLEAYFTDLPERTALTEAIGNHPRARILPDFTLEPLPEENWVEKTQRGLHPIEAGRFYIHGSHDRDKARAKTFSIEIDAGEAFGTAHHGTTRGCLILLDRLAKKVQPHRILDLGTGSGVLAIAAAKSMRQDVIATDIDPVAIRVAKENFAHNGVGARITAQTAIGVKHPIIARNSPFELITANILAAPLISLAPAIRKILAPGGDLILSGMLNEQAGAVFAAYRNHAFNFSARLRLDGWTSLHLSLR